MVGAIRYVAGIQTKECRLPRGTLAGRFRGKEPSSNAVVDTKPSPVES